MRQRPRRPYPCVGVGEHLEAKPILAAAALAIGGFGHLAIRSRIERSGLLMTGGDCASLLLSELESDSASESQCSAENRR